MNGINYLDAVIIISKCSKL